MSDVLNGIVFTLIGYGLGCLVTGYYLVHTQLGTDVRDCASRSTGATNVGRLLGAGGFVTTFAGDACKGSLAMFLAKWNGCQEPWLALVLLAVVAGHIWPAQLGFKGGKGIAAALGGLLVYDPHLTVALAGVFSVAFLLTRALDAGGMIAFVCLPIIAALMGRPAVVIIACMALTTLLLRAHRENLITILDRFGSSSA